MKRLDLLFAMLLTIVLPMKVWAGDTEVKTNGNNCIVSDFIGFDTDTYALKAEDKAYNWLMALPYSGVTLDNATPTTWNGEQCLHMHLSIRNDAYTTLTFTSAFTVLGKVKKIILKAGGDIKVFYSMKENGDIIWSDRAINEVTYCKEWVLDFGNGIDANDVLTFYLDTGWDVYFKSVTIVMDDGEEMEIDGIMSTFYDWEEENVTDSYKDGRLKSKEDTPWYTKFYDPTTKVYSTMLMEGNDESTLQQCMVISNSGNVEAKMMNMFDVSGTIKKIIVRYSGVIENMEATIFESGTEGEAEQYFSLAPVTGSGMFSETELLFDGTTKYTNASITLSFYGSSPLFLQSITILQEDDNGGGDGPDPNSKCGDNLYYTITQLPYNTVLWDEVASDYVEVPANKLTITGTGEMYDYWDNPAPWIETYQKTLTEIVLPEGMTHVGISAFYGCYKAKANIPSTLTSIGAYAFYNLLEWPDEDLRLPEDLTFVGDYAFTFGLGFKNLYVPKNLTYIGEAAFSGINGLENFYVDNANPVYKADGNAIIEEKSKKLIAGNAYTVIPDYVETIGSYAFAGLRMETIAIPGSLIAIDPYAFSSSYITRIDIPSNVKTIGSGAFNSCRTLLSVTIGSGVTSIGYYAFNYCKNILDVYCYADPDALTWTTYGNENNSFKPDKMTKMHVRAADLEKWQEKFDFLNVTFVGDLGGSVAPIIQETTVAVSSLANEDLTDNVVDGIYYNLDASTGNGYMNGCLCIKQTTDMSLISDANPGSSDVSNNFTGIILQVAPGKGVIAINARAFGNVQLAVRIGNGTPTYAPFNERMETYISYNVTVPTYVYIYAVDSGTTLVKAFANGDSGSNDNALLIYGISVIPGADEDGIKDVKADDDTWFDLSGNKLQGMPSKRGIFIQNGRKIMIK